MLLYLCLVEYNNVKMKSSELHRLIKRNGWVECRQAGSHVIYKKDGNTQVSVPYHGNKEVPKGMEVKFKREMGLK